MNRLESLKIARIAYKQINAVIEKWNTGVINYVPINFHWDGCITIGDELFHERELMEFEDDD